MKKARFLSISFFWQSDENKATYHLARWDTLCRPKDQGGLGIEDHVIKNTCLLSKWLYRLASEED